ncbi:ORF6N domain-containing protein [Desulfobacterales bacterium HSG2]|nr:ORF6N domain-containing protein [Desulfobacterales bacterium HSG2]
MFYDDLAIIQPAILGKQVAELHDYELRHVNELVVNNLEWFDEGIDFIDLKSAIVTNDSKIQNFLLDFYSQKALNASKHIFIFSQQGYAMLIKFLKSDLAKQIYKQMVREYFGMKAAAAEDEEAVKHLICNVRSLSHVADDDAALEKMFRKRKQLIMGMGFDKSDAILKAVESIRNATGIDLTERMEVRFSELGQKPETSASESETSARLHKKEVSASESETSAKLHKKDSAESVPETPAKVHTDTKPVSRVPRNYRGWNLNKRGKNKKGKVIFNLSKKIGGKKRQKYLGVWDQEKADRIIDEMNQKYGLEESS